MTFRGFLMWVHLILGLTGAVVIAIASVTGAYITFQVPLQRWLNPVPAIETFGDSADFQAIVETVEQQFASTHVTLIDVRAREATVVGLRDGTTVFVDPRTTTIIGMRPSRLASLGNLTALMRRLHTSLLLGPKGSLLITIATAEALFLALTGLWLWWRRKHWQFSAWRGSPFRVSWDLHNATGIWFLVPVLSMVVTGLLIYFPAPVTRIAGGERTPFRRAPSSIAESPDSSRVPMSRVLVVADSASPGDRIMRVVIPSGRAGAFAVAKAGRTIYVDQYNATVIEVRPVPVLTAADRANLAVEHLHTGELLGLPGRVIMTLGSLMLVVMTVTGAVLGWKRLLILIGRRAEA